MPDDVLACSLPSPQSLLPRSMWPFYRMGQRRLSSFTAMVEENLINMVCSFGFGIGFTAMTPKAQQPKKKWVGVT